MDEKGVQESCGHEAPTQVSPMPLLSPLLSLLRSLGLSVSGLRWFVLQTRHIFSVSGGGCELDRELLLPGLSARASQLGTLRGGYRPVPGPRCSCQDEHRLLSCSPRLLSSGHSQM